MVVPEDRQKSTEQLTKATTELQLSKGELKKMQRELDVAQEILAQKERKHELAKTNVEVISMNYRIWIKR